jgi:hypothetical protein
VLLRGLLDCSQVATTTVLLLEDFPRRQGQQLLSIEVQAIHVSGRLKPDKVHATATVGDLVAHDLCTHGPGVGELLLSRWMKGAPDPEHATSLNPVRCVLV